MLFVRSPSIVLTNNVVPGTVVKV